MIKGVSRGVLAAVAECAGEGCAGEDAEFAAEQIGRLPFFYRFGAGVLAWVFEAEVLFRCRRRFAGLPLAARRERWRAWQQSGLRAKRDFTVLCESLIFFSRFSRGEDGG